MMGAAPFRARSGWQPSGSATSADVREANANAIARNDSRTVPAPAPAVVPVACSVVEVRCEVRQLVSPGLSSKRISWPACLLRPWLRLRGRASHRKMGCGASTAKPAEALEPIVPNDPVSPAAAPVESVTLPVAPTPENIVPDGPVIFVLGGPGSGKGTQCAKLVERYGAAHYSAGDLLRAEVVSKSPDGQMIDRMIKEGQIVPAQVTIDLLKKAVKARPGPYLIDGFPRSVDNLEFWEAQCGACALTLFYDLSEEVMQARLLERGKTSGRTDDNLATIKKRFETFEGQSKPVVKLLDAKGLVATIDASASPDDVFVATCAAVDKVAKALEPSAPVAAAASEEPAAAAEEAAAPAAPEPEAPAAEPEEPTAEAPAPA